MKRNLQLLLVAVLASGISLFLYQQYLLPVTEVAQQTVSKSKVKIEDTLPQDTGVKFVKHFNSSDADFTQAAKKTVHAVVHVKNVSIGRAPRTIQEYLRGMRGGRAVQGAGSGVIITEDGYIVTNYHVIKDASEIEVTLNNNRNYKAKLIGAEPNSDIALLKIEAKDLEYLTFGDSNDTQIGEWVLAVGNPFNLTSTVTAGIISAKGRNLGAETAGLPSFIQTDAAINPGNSGGALVNINGELIGINTAITSQTGSYIGYGFAVPSNNARKIVEDLIEYGNVKHAILGIQAATINPNMVEENELKISQGVYVAGVSDGAKEAGLKKDDLITNIDGLRVRKLEDLTSYVQTKRPNDVVNITFIRNGNEKTTEVKLTEFERLRIIKAGIEVGNASKEYLQYFKSEYGVKILGTLNDRINIPDDQFIITRIDDQKISSVKDAKKIIQSKAENEKTKITFKDRLGREESYYF